MVDLLARVLRNPRHGLASELETFSSFLRDLSILAKVIVASRKGLVVDWEATCHMQAQDAFDAALKVLSS